MSGNEDGDEDDGQQKGRGFNMDGDREMDDKILNDDEVIQHDLSLSLFLSLPPLSFSLSLSFSFSLSLFVSIVVYSSSTLCGIFFRIFCGPPSSSLLFSSPLLSPSPFLLSLPLLSLLAYFSSIIYLSMLCFRMRMTMMGMKDSDSILLQKV